MTSKVQGEGDYESARRYNKETREFVEEKQAKGEPMKGSAAEAQDELTPAEKEARKHAKAGDQDQRDAELLRESEQKH